MVATTQHSFASGEVSPSFYGRCDHPRYRAGVACAENMVVTRSGGLRRRAGFHHAFAISGGGRCIPLSFQTDNGVAFLAMTTSRVYYNSGASSLRVPWSQMTEDELTEVQAVQYGDVMTLTCPGRAPLNLTWNGYTFTLLTARWTVYDDWSAPRADPPTVLLTIGCGDMGGAKYYYDYSDPTKYRELEWGKQYEASAYAPESKDGNHPRLPWEYRITFIYDIPELGGEVEAVSDLDVKPENGLPLYVDWYKVNLWISVPRAPGNVVPKKCRVYRGREGVFGLVCEIKAPSLVADFDYMTVVDGVETLVHRQGGVLNFTGTDVGETPDLSVQPPEHLTGTPSQFVSSGTLPLTFCYFEQRGVVGGTSGSKSTLYFSRTGRPFQFTCNPELAPLPTDAIEARLSNGEREEIRCLAGFGGRLVVMTDKNLWDVSSRSGIQPTDIKAVRYSGVGASRLQPIQVRNTVLFCSSAGNEIHEVRLDQQGTQWATRELGQYSRHLLDGRKVVSWAFQKTPDPVVWMVMDDGSLVSMTYCKETELVAWSHHSIPAYVYGVASDGEKVCLSVGRGEATEVWIADPMNTSFLDGRRIVSSPAEASEKGLKAWKQFSLHPVTAMETKVSVPTEAKGSGPCIAGEAVVAKVVLLDAISHEDVGLRPKTLKKVSIDHMSNSSLRLGESLEGTLTPERLSDTSKRRITDAHVIHSYGFEATGAIVSEAPVPLNILSVAREVDFGEQALPGAERIGR